MNKLSMNRLKTPPKIVTKGWQAANADKQSDNSTIINRLHFDESSANSATNSPRKSLKSRPAVFRFSSDELESLETLSPPDASPSGQKKLKSIKSLQTISVNANSKVRLERKYEEALEKLTQLKSHYELRRCQKYEILNQKASQFSKKGRPERVAP